MGMRYRGERRYENEVICSIDVRLLKAVAPLIAIRTLCVLEDVTMDSSIKYANVYKVLKILKENGSFYSPLFIL